MSRMKCTQASFSSFCVASNLQIMVHVRKKRCDVGSEGTYTKNSNRVHAGEFLFFSWQTFLAFFLFASSGEKYAKIFDVRHIAMHLFLVEVRNRKKKNGHFRFTLFQAKEQQRYHHQAEKKTWRFESRHLQMPACQQMEEKCVM